MGSLLKRRSVDRDTAREACQHAFAVFIDKRPAVDSTEHAFAWLNIVAHRQVSKWQRRRRWETADEPPERVVPDVAESIEPRLFLAAAVEAFDQLRPEDRDTLRSAAEGGERGLSRRERNRIALHVHRARKRLRSKLEGWWTVFPWARWRRATVDMPNAWSPALGVNVLTVLVLGGAALLPADTRPGHPILPAAAESTKTALPRVHVEDRRPAALTHEQGGVSMRERTASTASTAPAPSEPRPKGPEPGPLDNRVEVDSPATHGPVEIETRPRRPGDDALTCWGNLVVVPDGCIAHPLRQRPL